MAAMYRILGRSKQMRSVFVSDGEGGFKQRPIRQGINFFLTEEELNSSPHVRRQELKKILRVIPVEEPVVEEPVVEPEVEYPGGDGEVVNDPVDLPERPPAGDPNETPHAAEPAPEPEPEPVEEVAEEAPPASKKRRRRKRKKVEEDNTKETNSDLEL